MSNKFLGLNSVNVIKDYIDKSIESKIDDIVNAETEQSSNIENYKVKLHYNDNHTDVVTIHNFSEYNMYISNIGTDDGSPQEYELNFNDNFENGSIGTIANIGLCSIIIKTTDYMFLNGGNKHDAFNLEPFESVDIICYENNNIKCFLVTGKDIKDTNDAQPSEG